MTNRQTVSYLTRRFREVGLRPDTRHGQNFLIDLNLVHLLADAAELGPRDVVLEVGTGTGSLTALLASKAVAVVTVEISAELFILASEELAKCDNVTMLQHDVLKNKHRFDPRVLQALDERLSDGPGRRLKLAANLPYNIATPVISNLLLTPVCPASMTVTIQKELADRMMARPRTKDYSALTVWVQSQCDVSVVRELPPTVFWPQPKVHSAIIQVVPSSERRAKLADPVFFHQFVRHIFQHRRKFLRTGLINAYKKQIGKAGVDRILEQLQLDADARAEQLDVDTLVALGDAARMALHQSGA